MPGTCALAPHIALIEAGASYDTENVPRDKLKSPEYLAVNSKGVVPSLRLYDGSILTESTAILLHIGDKFPKSNFVPAVGTKERDTVHRWLGYLRI